MDGYELGDDAITKIRSCGQEFVHKADDLSRAIGIFTAAARIPASAAGSIGSGPEALRKYGELLDGVTRHLADLHRDTRITGENLVLSANNFAVNETRNTVLTNRAGR